MIRIRLTLATVMWSALFLTAAWLSWTLSTVNSGVPHVVFRGMGTVLAVGAVACLVAVRGSSLRQWVVRRWRVRDKLEESWIVNVRDKAMVWDGQSASMFIEVFGDPWTLSSVKSDGTSTTRKIPLADIRKELRQFDILVNHIRVIEYGYKTVTRDRASSAVLGVMGTVGHFLGGRTFIQLSVDLKRNLNPVHARRKDMDTVADGLTRTVSIATERVLRTINSHNIRAKILSPVGVVSIQRDILSGVGKSAEHNSWDYAGVPGDARIGTLLSFVPSFGAWSTSNQTQWGEVMSHRQYNCLTLSPNGVRDTAEFSLSYLTDDPGTLHLLPSQGLFRENGRHLARMSNALPLSRDMFRDSGSAREIERDSDIGLDISVHPLGVYLGIDTITRERIYLCITRGSSCLWITGDDEYARRLILRLSTQKFRIAIFVEGNDWDHLINTRKSRTLARSSSLKRAASSSDVIVCSPEQSTELELSDDSPSIIIVSSTLPLIDTGAFIEVTGDTVVVTAGKLTRTLIRDTSPAERPWLEVSPPTTERKDSIFSHGGQTKQYPPRPRIATSYLPQSDSSSQPPRDR